MPPLVQFLNLFFLLSFAGLAATICYQDFKAREISVWLLIIYALLCITSVYFRQGAYALVANLVSALLYFGLIFGAILLYYFIKEKKFSNPIDSKIGLADVILFLAIGLTMEPVELVLFFSVVFLISAGLGLLWFNKKERTVPLGGFLCIGYCLYFFITYLSE